MAPSWMPWMVGGTFLDAKQMVGGTFLVAGEWILSWVMAFDSGGRHFCGRRCGEGNRGILFDGD